MRHIFGTGLLLAILINVTTGRTTTRAMTCTDREQVCFAYCDKHNPDRDVNPSAENC